MGIYCPHCEHELHVSHDGMYRYCMECEFVVPTSPISAKRRVKTTRTVSRRKVGRPSLKERRIVVKAW